MKTGDYIKFKDSGRIYKVKYIDITNPVLTRPSITHRHTILLPEDDVEETTEAPYITVWEVNGTLFINKEDALKHGDNPIERKVYD